MKFIFLILALNFLAGCGSQLRKPFCSNGTTQLPPEFAGTYEVTIPTSSPTWSGAMILKPIQVQLNAQGAFSSVPLQLNTDWGQVCKVSGRYFAEQRNSNGTYSVSELSKFSSGFIVSSLSINLDAAKAAGYPLHYLPSIKSAVKENDGAAVLFPSDSFILDNSGLTPEQVLKITQTAPFQTVFSEVKAPLVFRSTTQLRWSQLRR